MVPFSPEWSALHFRLQCLVFFISNFVIQAAVNSFGPVTMAGNAAASNLEMFVWVFMSGFEQAGMTYISQNLGAGEYKRIDRANAVSLLCTFLIGVILGNIVSLCAGPLMRIYTPDTSAVAQGSIRLHLICSMYFFCGLMDCLASNIRGLGYSLLPSIVTVFGACVLRLVWIFTIFSIPRYHTLFCLFMAYPCSWAVTALILAVCYIIVRRNFTGAERLNHQ